MSHKTKRATLIVVVLVILLGPCIFWLVLIQGKNNYKTIPVYGNPELRNYTDGSTDTIQHTIPDFSFTDWTGKQVSLTDLKHHVFVADFFFTTCQTICPKMSEGMYSIQYKFKDDSLVKFISYTVDPETDSVPVLKAYADKYRAQAGKWYLVTGDKKQIYDLARQGYLLPVLAGNGGASDFIHSEKLVLVDHKQRIRGYFDGTDKWEVDSLKDAVKLLEYEMLVDEAKKK